MEYGMDEEKKMGRPTDFTDELVDRICEEIAAGRSLNKICSEEDWSPDKSTFYRWMYRHPQIRDKYARAKNAQQEYAAEDIMEIAYSATPETYNVARLQIDAHKWLASKLLPKRYSEKQQIEHTGEDGGPLVIKWKGSDEE
jgi:GrpB-like predicted nucleotidyltransferase (UPF0157 family)